MTATELETVLANWIREATSSTGQLSGSQDSSAWIAQRLVEWWRHRAGGSLDDVELCASRIQAELVRLGGWKNSQLGDAMEEATHLREAIEDLRAQLGIGPASGAKRTD